MTTEWNGTIHRYASLLPEMSPDDFDELVDDIRRNGLLTSIWLTPDGTLLDGRHRLRACQQLGIEPRAEVYDGDDLLEFVISTNVNRRHLTPGQCAFVALNVLAAFEEEAQRRRLEGNRRGGQASAGSTTVADLPATSVKVRARDKAARASGSSGRAVGQAKRLQGRAPDLAAKVVSGDLALDKADRELTRRLRTAEELEARNILLSDVQADRSGDCWRMLLGDFRERLEEIPDGSVDLIVTDPPYPAEFMPLWSEVSRHAARVLKRQGILVSLSGQFWLPDVMSSLGQHLHWGWMYVQPLNGANSRVMGRQILQSFKPWLAFSNGPWPSGMVDWHPDVLDPGMRMKDRYRWEQDGNPTKMLIDTLSTPGGIVLDLFTGTGSYGVAALEMGRQFVGIEMDADRFVVASDRLADLEASRLTVEVDDLESMVKS